MSGSTANDTTDGSSRRRLGAEILAASFIVLFQELTFIRWIPGQVRVLAYFPNVVLISAFLGLGLGALIARRRSIAWLWPVMSLITTATAWALAGVAFTHESKSEYLWLLYYDLPRNAPVSTLAELPIVVFFILSAATFLPLGQFLGQRLQRFREMQEPLRGYAWDLLGSLLGVIAFACMSFLNTFPIFWFATFLLIGSFLFLRHRAAMALHAIAAVAMLIVVQRAEKADAYSPYYALAVEHRSESTIAILANRSLHQVAVAMKPSDDPRRRANQILAGGYAIPYRALKTKPRRVLILGAGSGNDVSIALQQGAEEIDAVEIDPAILDIGKRLHPDRPYDSPRVNVIRTDARAFLNHSSKKYDLIVFGTLDSMTRLSALSSVRLDNFVYTRDCIAAAKRHLNQNGGLAMYFKVSAPFIDRHLVAMLADVFSAYPTIVRRDFQLFNRVYMAGPGYVHLTRQEQSQSQLREFIASQNIPTDDWPYLYLNERSVTPFYLGLIAIFAAIAAIAVFTISGDMRRSIREGGVDIEMFCFGLAFLLLETKLVTETNLVWGATWITSAVVFGSILLTILIGTLLVNVRPIRWSTGAWGLIVALLVSYVVPAHAMSGLPFAWRLLASLFFVGVPILFASFCFALLFRQREHVESAFGWNLLGAVAGGLIEFTSMAIGLKSLTLIALAAYLIAFLRHERLRTRAANG